ncbi:hypothetical protein BX666DRAFT_1922933 [Dichotomocladium elegans]|nr:hypothetical protein BX666DRAFT_1922933 [Dichotomocladium elegans]
MTRCMIWRSTYTNVESHDLVYSTGPFKVAFMKHFPRTLSRAARNNTHTHTEREHLHKI